ncbi:MAG: hypothetical protein N3E37_02960 [Candidatus Micrarchaeota archaeon]|nr:hypothetical protein [Candidatus Micrarchaeota archaeon]
MNHNKNSILILPKKKSEMEKFIFSNAGKIVQRVETSSYLGKKTLAKLIGLIKFNELSLPKSIARRMNLSKLLRTNIEIIIVSKKRGRKNKIEKKRLDINKLKKLLEKKVISRRTYFYYKKELCRNM